MRVLLPEFEALLVSLRKGALSADEANDLADDIEAGRASEERLFRALVTIQQDPIDAYHWSAKAIAEFTEQWAALANRSDA